VTTQLQLINISCHIISYVQAGAELSDTFQGPFLPYKAGGGLSAHRERYKVMPFANVPSGNGSLGYLTQCGRVTQICVFTLQLCKTDDANLRF